jgi:hypothetical protein
MTLTSGQIQRLLDEPIYSLDVVTLLSGLVDFLQFSEQNIGAQRRRAVAVANQEADVLDLGTENSHLLPQVRRQMVESAELRFDIGLSQSVRYAGMIAYVTAIEWCMKLFAARLSQPLPPKSKTKNEAVHTLKHLNTTVGHRLSAEIATLEGVIYLRNCIVHAAGFVQGYKYEGDVRRVVTSLTGFTMSNANFIGDQIHVQAGAIDHMAQHALIWIPALDEQCSTSGAFKKASSKQP